MSLKLDQDLAEKGTKFKIFPQPRFLPSFKTPETIRVSVPAGKVGPGPSDDRMYVIDAVNKLPYEGWSQPPYAGPTSGHEAKPNSNGHFDHLDVDSREFSCAVMYATVRRTLDIWEDYFRKPLGWHFRSTFERLEMIPLIEWDNAQSGFGFLEFGFGRDPLGGVDRSRPYCQNFDVLAHELGHSIIFSQVGVPSTPGDPALDYGGMHESSGDLVAIVAAMHSHKVIDHLLNKSCGNLFSANELQRVGELSEGREIRAAFNSLRMSDVGDEPHERSLPLTGGCFDVMVEVYQKNLVQAQLITADLARRSTQGPGGSQDLARIRADFEAAFPGKAEGFKACLLQARDYLGSLLARTWSNLSPDFLSYHDILLGLLDADLEVSGGAHQSTIRECFAWRQLLASSNNVSLRSIRRLSACGLPQAR